MFNILKGQENVSLRTKIRQQVRDKIRGDFLKYSDIFATYQKACNFQEPLLKHDALKDR